MKKIIIIVFLICFMFSYTARAEDTKDINISYSVPFGGAFSIQGDDWLRIDIVIENKGAAFTGQLQLRQTPEQRHLIVSQHISLSENSSQSFTFEVPARDLAHQNPYIRVQVEDRQEHRSLQKALDLRYLPSQTIIVSEQERAFDFIRILEHNWSSFERPQVISPADWPEESWLISADIVGMGALAAGRFTETQLQALHEWVKSGGILIVSGGVALLPYKEDLAQLLPLEDMYNMMEQDVTPLLESLDTDQLPLDQLDLLSGKPKKNTQFFPTKELPLFVGQRFGHGLVIMAAYDVTTEPLASWSGNSILWQNVFEQFAIDYTINRNREHAGVQQLFSVSQKIPGVNPPSLGAIVVIWVIYLFMVGPLLYLILKKYDKREWSWGLIPLVVICAALTVYGIGINKVVRQPTSHMASYVQIFDEQWAKISSAASFFVLNGNDYRISLNEEIKVIPGWQSGQFWPTENLLKMEGDHRYLLYEDVPYMTLTHATAMKYSSTLGYIDHHLYVQEDRLQGKLINKTKMKLEDIYVTVGLNKYQVGDLEAGQERELAISLEQPFFPTDSVIHDFPVKDEYWAETMITREDQVVENIVYSPYPVIGFQAKSDHPLQLMSIDQQDAQAFYTNYVYQEMTLQEAPDQLITYPYGFLPVQLGEVSGELVDPYDHSVILSKATVQFSLYVAPPGVDIKRIEVPINESPFQKFTIQVWNERKSEWEVLPSDKPWQLLHEEVANYVSPRGQLQLKFENPGKEPFQLPFPYFTVEGERNS